MSSSMPYHHHLSASASFYHSPQQQSLYHHHYHPARQAHSPFAHNTPSRRSHNLDQTTMQRVTPPPRASPLYTNNKPNNHNRWPTPPSRTSHWHNNNTQWTPPRPAQRFTTPPKHPMEDVTPRLPTCQLPLTPEWFPIDLPDSLPLPLEKPQAPLHIYREPSPPSGLLFSSNMTFWEPPSENDVPFLTRSELSSPVSRVVVTPELPSDTPIHRDQVCHTVIQKRTMETSLLQQPLPATPLCEIVKEGQLCHLRRHERAGVFVRSTVKFE
ncbi:hypothetical protein M408DRAFT_151867 [Serendipita vermifera MAFF 305830]|uniref:Uncharacterized protein n=1 Tax=Serendipita vermifera MAFF 305830 TaxID=933852 RepID=A0A0C2XWL1_SERVB|nr:hypothetical protein M408DRAFT_151867 [Serendipita vermifera MAFF 305830]